MAMTKAERAAHDDELSMYRQYVAIRPDATSPDVAVYRGDTAVLVYCVRTPAGLEHALAVLIQDDTTRLLRVAELRRLAADWTGIPETWATRSVVETALADASTLERSWLDAGCPPRRCWGMRPGRE